MLPLLILNEVFDIAYNASDVAVTHICDELESYHYSVENVQDYGSAILINFHNTQSDGELLINRVTQEFEITRRRGEMLLLPTRGDWSTVVACLNLEW